MLVICLMVRENHKMVREMSGKSQGILWGLMAGHPDGEKPSLGIFQTWLLILMDLQYIPLNIGFTIYTSKYMI